MSSGPRIALIHALEESVAPTQAAFAKEWPDAQAFHLLDSSLSRDLAISGLDRKLIERFIRLADYASTSEGIGGSTAGILFTCSAFGAAISAVKERLDIPVLTPNESAFAEAAANFGRIGLLVSFEPSLQPLHDELEQTAKHAGRDVAVVSAVAEGALLALKRGSGEEHDELVEQAARAFGEVDALLLGQFSLARSADRLRARFGLPVVTTPGSAVRRLRHLLIAGQ